MNEYKWGYPVVWFLKKQTLKKVKTYQDMFMHVLFENTLFGFLIYFTSNWNKKQLAKKM